eukprot:8497369-Pyramimonas_sp.AAC.1
MKKTNTTSCDQVFKPLRNAPPGESTPFAGESTPSAGESTPSASQRCRRNMQHPLCSWRWHERGPSSPEDQAIHRMRTNVTYIVGVSFI